MCKEYMNGSIFAKKCLGIAEKCNYNTVVSHCHLSCFKFTLGNREKSTYEITIIFSKHFLFRFKLARFDHVSRYLQYSFNIDLNII